MIWRWDQGRSGYFRVDTIVSMAKVLAQYDGRDIRDRDNSFRADLMQATGQPFAPDRYTIKRNYKRVFECALLATCNGDILVASDICKALANDDTFFNTSEDYLLEFERRFRYPFPAFQNYDDFVGRCYPFLAILKLLIARGLNNPTSQPSLSIEEIGRYLIANNVSGTEPIEFYKELAPREFSFTDEGGEDHLRQVREMLKFISQHNYLSYTGGSLIMPILSEEQLMHLSATLAPFDSSQPAANEIEDFIQITRLTSPERAVVIEDVPSLEDFQIVEGTRVFQNHFSRERSAKLRKKFIERNPEPVCDICGNNMKEVYPWTDFMLDVHHITPLSSSFEEGHGITTASDVVGLCPSCHRAVHVYYKNYLSRNSKSDFDSKEEARAVYYQAKESMN